MKNKKSISILIITIMIISTTNLVWANPTGKEIMERVDNKKSATTSKQTTKMELISKNGSVRKRSMIGYNKDFGEVEKTVIVFQEPSDVKGVGYLSFSYEELGKEDNRWLYLPALKKPRRISGSSSNDYFMGTDFTYDDMGDRKVEEDSHKFIKNETIDGYDCWVVESTPKEKNYMYSKKVFWVRKDVLIAIKVDYYDRQNKLMKTLTVSDIVKIDDIWTPKKMVMNNIQKKHKTILQFENIQFNIDISNSYFSVVTLEKGRIK